MEQASTSRQHASTNAGGGGQGGQGMAPRVRPWLVVGLCLAASCGGEDLGWLRVIHLSSNVAAVDVGFDGERRVRSLDYGASSGYMSTSLGELNVRVVAEGASTAVVDITVTMEAGQPTTIFLIDSAGEVEVLTEHDRRSASADGAAVRLVHAVEGVSTLRLQTAKKEPLTSQAFGAASDYQHLTELKPALQVLDGADNLLLSLKATTLEKGAAYTMVVYGTASEEDFFPLVTRIFSDTKEAHAGLDPKLEDAWLMVLHASPEADRVTARVEEELITSSALSYLDSASYAAVSAGTRKVTLSVVTGDTVFFEEKKYFKSAARYTAVIADLPEKISTLFFEDRLPDLPAGKTAVRFMHLAPGHPSVDLKVKGDVADLFSSLSFKRASVFSPLPVGDHTLQVLDTKSGQLVKTFQTSAFKEGRIYSIYLHGTKEDLGLGFLVND